jgi:cation:H+ antiporter
MGSLSSGLLVLLFAGAAVAIWLSGIRLSQTTDSLDMRLGLGSALGGLILLSIATDLPELAITVSAAAAGNLELAVGNLLGGIAVQTLVLVALDAASPGRPLTHRPGSLIVVLEASIVVATLVVAIMSTQLPGTTEVVGVGPGTAAIVLIWVGGLALVSRARAGIPWQIEAPGADPGRSMHQRRRMDHPAMGDRSTLKVAAIFAAAALVTLGAGVLIEATGSELAGRMGLSGAVFGATILAAFTALPELSTGIASVRLGDYGLAFSDIFGGNAFLPVLFLVADLVAGQPALPGAQATDLWMAGLGVVLTVIYIAGLLMRPDRERGRLGPDSVLALAVYALGIAGLFAIS